MSPLRSRAACVVAVLTGALVHPLTSGTAGAADAWEAPRTLTSGGGVVAAAGTDVLLADWVDTSPSADTPQKSLRLQRSLDDGITFSTVQEPADASAVPFGQATGAVVFGPAVALVVSQVEAVDGPATRLDRHEPDAGWSPPVSLSRAGCEILDTRAAVAASDTSVVIADACGIWRSTDGGGSFTSVAAPGPIHEVEALTVTDGGFSLLYDAVPSGSDYPQLFSSASANDGATFSAPVQLTPAAGEQADGTRAVQDSLTGALVAVTNIRVDPTVSSPAAGLRLEVRRSADGGRTWGAPSVLHDGAGSTTGEQGSPPLPAATESGLDLTAATYDAAGARRWLRWTSADAGATWLRGPAPAFSGDEALDRPASAAGGAVAHLLREGAYTRTSGAANGSDTQADVPPTLALSPATISAGQPTVVTYRGTPGSTVDILSRTQPATVFSKIGTVTIGADGTGQSTHRPQKNTRITARTASGQLSETAPIIAVRSVASFNVKRVGTRTYTLTGRVYPALRNRLVNVYRNGTLVAQGRCDATGIYTITKTLAAGTFTFQVRTPNDQDNLGTTSRELRVAIS